ncbi:hypothetical protein [Bifidobacterium jacchi]|uniref:hypothetical protein n=1 Tax=Bifidobacterium jacchi TaxID=2490545 RepID=UPI001F4FC272|nr:hypothetical protein [Bifidobacterium jacchi]
MGKVESAGPEVGAANASATILVVPFDKPDARDSGVRDSGDLIDGSPSEDIAESAAELVEVAAVAVDAAEAAAVPLPKLALPSMPDTTPATIRSSRSPAAWCASTTVEPRPAELLAAGLRPTEPEDQANPKSMPTMPFSIVDRRIFGEVRRG